MGADPSARPYQPDALAVWDRRKIPEMSIAIKIILNLGILTCVYMMDETGYAVYFTGLALVRYELGPMLADKEPQ